MTARRLLELAVLLSLLVLVRAVRAQRLETMVYLPDSLGGLGRPRLLFHDWVHDVVYVGGTGDCLLAIDAPTGQKVARIPLPSGAEGFCHNPAHDELYVACRDADAVAVVDLASRRAVADIPAIEPWSMCHNSADNKLYCVDNDFEDLVVIDCATHRVVRRIDLGSDVYPVWVRYNPSHNKVYCADYEGYGLFILDGQTDSVITILPDYYFEEDYPVADYHLAADKFYFADWDIGALVAVDGATDEVAAVLRFPDGIVAICCDEDSGRVYCADRDRNVAVVDVSRDSVLAVMTLGFRPDAMVFDPRARRLYCNDGSTDSLAVIDPDLRRVERTVGTGDCPYGLCVSPNSGRVFCTVRFEGSVWTFNSRLDSLVAVVPTGVEPAALCVANAEGRVFVGCDESRSPVPAQSVIVVDADRNQAIARLQGPHSPDDVQYNPAAGKVYCVGDTNRVFVYDARGDALRARVNTGHILPDRICVNPNQNKVYVSSPDVSTVGVIDGDEDRLVQQLTVGRNIREMCYNLTSDKLYCATENGVLAIIDGRADTTILQLPVGIGSVQAMCWNPAVNKVYVSFGSPLDRIEVIDGENDELLARIELENDATELCCLPASDRLFFRSSVVISYGVIDCVGDTLLGYFDIPGSCFLLSCDTIAAKLYVGGTDRYQGLVFVFDALTDRLLKMIPLPAEPYWGVAWLPEYRRMYYLLHGQSGLAVVTDAPPGVQEGDNGRPESMVSRATVIARGVLSLPLAGLEQGRGSAVLVDISGRRVMDLRAGENDLRGVAPGVYFLVMGESRGSQRVIIQR